MTDTTEPKRITAGDTVSWLKSISDYPASAGWSLSYTLINATGKIAIDAVAQGEDYLVSIPANVSAEYTPGAYPFVAVVTKAGERHTVGRGSIIVDPDLAAQAGGYDTRSNARIILDNLLLAYRTASADQAFVQDYEVAGRRLSFNAKADWIIEIDYWKREVAKELRAKRLADGLDAGTKVYVRF